MTAQNQKSKCKISNKNCELQHFQVHCAQESWELQPKTSRTVDKLGDDLRTKMREKKGPCPPLPRNSILYNDVQLALCRGSPQTRKTKKKKKNGKSSDRKKFQQPNRTTRLLKQRCRLKIKNLNAGYREKTATNAHEERNAKGRMTEKCFRNRKLSDAPMTKPTHKKKKSQKSKHGISTKNCVMGVKYVKKVRKKKTDSISPQTSKLQ